jgi:hypothetical protein
MEIGIGIPNCVVGTTGAQLLDWARRAEAAGFSSLATIGAVSFFRAMRSSPCSPPRVR